MRVLFFLCAGVAGCAISAQAHPGHDMQIAAPPAKGDGGEARWLAGDHHIHSRFSVGYDESTTPPTPLLGKDARYPIPTNAEMARKFGLSWMVATDHGGPNHSKINREQAYPELLRSRAAVPEVIQFFGMELNTPGADHSSVIVPVGPTEADQLEAVERSYDSKEAWPRDPARNTEPKMLEALKAIDAQSPKPVVVAHHPSRSATGLGQYGDTGPAELRDWNDTAPQVAIGMEGAPGHQAGQQPGAGKPRPRGAYAKYPTMGGFDQMTARVGGFWDSMLGDGRRWWITATSDSHVHWSDGGSDFWPGEYSKTWVFAKRTPEDILAGLRGGRVFVATGDLIDALEVTAAAGKARVGIGGTVAVPKDGRVRITIRFRDPIAKNANGDDPVVKRVDLIRGSVTGPTATRDADANPTTRVAARFTAAQWRREGDWRVIETTLTGVRGGEYIRVRGTSTDEAEPLPDVQGESPWADLWFYANPVFLDGADVTRRAHATK
jgi:hypothetical protein